MSDAINNTSKISDVDWQFYSVIGGDSPIKDPKTLMYDYTLPEFLVYREYIEITNAIETARFKDEEANRKR